ncbi:IS200/IS605 family transposase [Persicimonas caeni]|uniref:IS200/IS605 family transposase n=1 Tax=Persicimonas caeni TaxID=2292766 RepID=A0A4Y6PP98_PERCE|nr:IS200/IS605 family transposase [Persicimonas caeni]QDG50134.1 IS200/IS605 family transposase [Persicimonas caeni]QED31355.1 IS200/IS605 family transposase [Persicimonas caeni]
MATKSYCEIYIHLVWRTKYSRRILSGDLELFVHQRLREIGKELDLTPLAVNSAWDHVHSFYRWHASTAVERAVRVMKSKTAVEWNKGLRNGEHRGEELKWQVGYGAVSTWMEDMRVVQNYVDKQKEHHRDEEVWTPFEKVRFDETPEADDEAVTYLAAVSGASWDGGGRRDAG